jgi:hypothetical protein
LGVKLRPRFIDPGGGVRSITLKYLSLGVPPTSRTEVLSRVGGAPPAGFAFKGDRLVVQERAFE